MSVRKHLAGAVIALSAIAWPAEPAFSQAQPPQAWPQRPVKLILPLGGGSGADIGARMFAERLSARWGQPVVVENRPGGDGFVAIGAFTSAKDDHTFLWGPAAAFTAHPYLHAQLPYDARDIVPIARVTTTLVAFAVPNSVKANSMLELMAEAKVNPGKLNWATVTGATDFVFAGWLKKEGIEMAKVPYRNPTGALNDLTEGRIHVFMAAYAIVRAQGEAGRLKILAMSNRERAVAAPNIPTVLEAGTPTLMFDGLVGLYGPRDLPAGLRDRIAADIRTIASDPEIVSRMTATGQAVTPGNPAEMTAAIDEQRKGLAAIAQILGVKAAQ